MTVGDVHDNTCGITTIVHVEVLRSVEQVHSKLFGFKLLYR